MTGRHAAPRERSAAPCRAAVVAGVATMTMPLSLPTAQAAPVSVNWDAVAQCESSGRWDLNVGTFDGGLQFLPSTWNAYGGRQYAPTANLASRSEQIAIAENVLRGQGIGAWPVCGKRGLGGTTANRGTPGTSRTEVREQPRRTTPAVPDQPRPVREAIAASGPSNPACVSLKNRGVGVDQLDRLNRAHPELQLDGNRNGVPCDKTFPRAASSSNTATPTGSSTSAGSSSTSATATTAAPSRSGVIATARRWLGTTYRYGGESGPGGSGIDCSSLVQQAFRANGIRLPRTADQQMRATDRISRSEARAGDLVFFTNSAGRAFHVGIYLGNGQMLNAPKPGTVVRIQAVWSDSARYHRP